MRKMRICRQNVIKGLMAVAPLLIAVAISSVAGAAERLYTPGSSEANQWSFHHEVSFLGNAFEYETGFGRVSVRAEGRRSGFTYSAGSKTFAGKEYEAGYDTIAFNVKSSFGGGVVGASRPTANLFTFKAVVPRGNQKGPNGEKAVKLGMQYRYLNGSSISGMHFVDLYSSVFSGEMEYAGGVTSYFIPNHKSRVGAFVSATYHAGKEVDLFAEYSSADFMKAVQNYVIAPAAQNIGTIDVGDTRKDAFSMGLKLRFNNNMAVKFSLYDLDVQRKPVIEGEFSR